MLPYSDATFQHATLTADTDTTFLPPKKAYAFRIVHWSTAGRLLVSLRDIASVVDATAARVGAASSANFPQVRVFPAQVPLGVGVHLRAAHAAEVTVEFFH